MKTILITGFEPFGDDAVNPSWEAALRVDGERMGDATIVARRLPCVVGTVQAALIAAIEETNPDVVIGVGLAAGRADISIERIAINIVDARIPDNAGHQPIDEPVIEEGPAAYFSALPIKAIARDLREAGIPASISQTAGTYVCNAMFYALRHYIATARPALRGGFVHVPLSTEMAARYPGQPTLPLDTLAAALRVMAATVATASGDIKLGAGTIA
ncbi:pyroglutamyl-peptidase I [Pararobbsia silviterrae]|uniref:Pyrrolidone-carboxylate peptidase n=1 Tax=Pararobbsia silviterrae TaxID=1792498 RepID=A0A494Y545_9BURK|nr:pyroglutamyl-peptidase I [Pararobbsia silviterrae]RKP56633.1 pyroglutamyl-peptidase I [Pararobbsia silviterrae]